MTPATPAEEAWMLPHVGINPDRTFGPHYRIRSGRAFHVNAAPDDPGAPAVRVAGKWRLARSEQ